MKLYSKLREQTGTAGLVVAVVALVAALAGGAIAANSDGGNAQSSAKAKGKKGPRGPKGATGPAGPAGPAGPQGTPGAAGANGKDGAPGANGKDGEDGEDGEDGQNGADGVSVTSTEFSGEQGPCDQGGAKFNSSSTPTYACNGSPWTAGGTLPPGQTETGVWSFVTPTGMGFSENIKTNLSFPIPLPGPLPKENVHYIDESGKEQPANVDAPEACQGSAEDPTAAPGHLCVYTTYRDGIAWIPAVFFPPIQNAGLVQVGGAGETGALLALTSGAKTEGGSEETASGRQAWGTWAVTSPQS